jgi:outer membrane biosynthesis protein TonB
MKKLDLKLKKNILISACLVVSLVAAGSIITLITKTQNVKDIPALANKPENIAVTEDENKKEEPQQVVVPEINTKENTADTNNIPVPKVTQTEVSKSQVVIQKEKTPKPEPPKEKPKTTDSVTDKSKVPTYPAKETKPQVQTPSAGEKNSKGQVYVPGFGWVKDEGSGGQGKVIDSNGDINKQVGNMN